MLPLFFPKQDGFIRLKLIVAYEGTRYVGWQVQKKPGEVALPSIQGTVQNVVRKIMGQYIVVHSSGRTDAGVHAESQVCHMDVPAAAATFNWLHSLNNQLPPDIRIRHTEIVPFSFHANKSACSKTYAYSLWVGPTQALPRLAPFCWSLPYLDIEKMETAAQYLVGTHDFASFKNAGGSASTTTRTVFSITHEPGLIGGLRAPKEWPLHSFHVSGSGFLKQMVRNMLGLLVWVGRGKLPAEAVVELLACKQRKANPSPSAPPRGLTLLDVQYPQACLRWPEGDTLSL